MPATAPRAVQTKTVEAGDIYRGDCQYNTLFTDAEDVVLDASRYCQRCFRSRNGRRLKKAADQCAGLLETRMGAGNSRSPMTEAIPVPDSSYRFVGEQFGERIVRGG